MTYVDAGRRRRSAWVGRPHGESRRLLSAEAFGVARATELRLVEKESRAWIALNRSVLYTIWAYLFLRPPQAAADGR